MATEKQKLVDTKDFLKPGVAQFLFQWIQPIFDRITGFEQMNRHYRNTIQTKPQTAEDFCIAGLQEMGIQLEIDPRISDFVNTLDEPCIAVANHPYGGVDSLAFMYAVGSNKPGQWKMLANKILHNVEALKQNSILVDPFAKKQDKSTNIASVREMHKTLKKKGILCMCPARRVSAWSAKLNAVCDLPWTSHPVALAKKHHASILFIHIDGQNSDVFLSIPPEQIMRRSIRLAKELCLQKNKSIKLTLSSYMKPETAAKIAKLSNSEEILKAHSYLGADKSPVKQASDIAYDLADIPNQDIDYLKLLDSTKSRLCEQAGFASFVFQGHEQPEVLEQIGRLREITFQCIGAGSGNEVDLSDEDQYYHHIAVIDIKNKQIAGAYRVGITSEIRSSHGNEGMYLNHIFDFTSGENGFYEQLGNAMELSRSFICPQYQKNPAILDLLWKSLGTVAKENKCTKLYGSVTVSAEFTPQSQSIIVDTLDRYHSAEDSMRRTVSNQNPFKATTKYHTLISDAYAPHGIGRLNSVIEELEEEHRSIPPLVRYYTTLGAKFLSFKVEPTFNNAIYCLLVVDLEKIPSRYKKRFLE